MKKNLSKFKSYVKNHWKEILFVLICFCGLFVWDCLTTSPYESENLTINPFNVDWKSFSLSNIDVNAVIQSLVSALLGVVFTIIIIENMLNKQKEKEEDKKRKETAKYILKAFECASIQLEELIIFSIKGKEGGSEHTLPKIIQASDFCYILNSTQFASNTPSVKTSVLGGTLILDSNNNAKIIDLLDEQFKTLSQWLMNLILNPNINCDTKISPLVFNYYKKIVHDNPCQLIRGLNENDIENLKETNFENVRKGDKLYHFVKLKELVNYHNNFKEDLKKILNDIDPDSLKKANDK